MMAATRSQKRVTGGQLEGRNNNPSRIQKELLKIAQKNKINKNKKVVAVERQGEVLEETTTEANEVNELPFVNVRPLPIVGRGQTKTNNISVDKDSVEKLPEFPKIPEEPNFKNRAPLQRDEHAKDLVQDTLKNTICITTEDLMNVSEPVRQEMRKLLMKKRMEPKSVAFGFNINFQDEVFDQKELISADKLPDATYEVLKEDTDGLAKGSVIVHDPVTQYFSALKPGEKAKSVVVAAESHGLRTVYPLINGIGEVESLLDPGSQIVSMSREVATALQIIWDPDIIVHMESANKSLERTLGLAKNIPFVFGPITVYLQVHVIEKVAYKVLLGRPFDTITESEVRNSKDGSQSLTLTDLNTGQRCVMQTHERGKSPTVLQRPIKQDFVSSSMN